MRLSEEKIKQAILDRVVSKNSSEAKVCRL